MFEMVQHASLRMPFLGLFNNANKRGNAPLLITWQTIQRKADASQHVWDTNGLTMLYLLGLVVVASDNVASSAQRGSLH